MKIVGLLFLLFTTFHLVGQETKVLLDGHSSVPIEGAIISIQDSLLSITDNQGRFDIAKEISDHIWISHLSYRDTILIGFLPDTIYLSRNSILLEPVTISFDKTSNLRSIPTLGYISTDIKTEHSRTGISQLLNTIPGVFMHSGALNTNRITIRGIGSRNLFGTAKIKAYLNDIPLTNGVGETTIEDMDLSLIDNIAIVKGPTSSLYGAGLGGMIHLNTKGSIQSNIVHLESGIGSYGLLTSRLSSVVDINATNRLILHLNQTNSDGYRANNEYDRLGFSLIGEHQLNPDLNLSFINNYIDLKANIPSSLNEIDFIQNPQIAASNWQSVNGFEDYTRWIWGVSGSYRLTDNAIMKASIFSTDFDSYESRPFNILQEDSQSIGLRATYKQNLDIQERPILSVEFGLETYYESYNWQTFETNAGIKEGLLSNNDEKRKYLNLFAAAHLDLSPGLHVQAGINYNKTTYDYLDQFNPDMIDLSGNYSFEGTLSPYININADIARGNPSNTLFVYGLISHGFSPPNLEETLLPNGQINPNIQPEKGINYEIGLKGTFSENFKINISGYAMTVKDLLVARRTSADQFIGINAGKTQHNGIEMSAGTNWSIGKIQFEFITDLAFQEFEFKEFIEDSIDYSGNKLTGTPSYQIRTELKTEPIDGLKIGIGNFAVGSQYLRDDNSIESDPYSIWHTFILYDFDLSPKWNLNILGRLENLFDQEYASMLLINAGSFGGSLPRYYYPGLPRNHYFSVTVTYQF
ncbi:MAG: TonB-dependent receptor [Bacteroidia bacterium]|nr:TonB-dependent receptor [Bacteroidia bacterium]